MKSHVPHLCSRQGCLTSGEARRRFLPLSSSLHHVLLELLAGGHNISFLFLQLHHLRFILHNRMALLIILYSRFLQLLLVAGKVPPAEQPLMTILPQ